MKALAIAVVAVAVLIALALVSLGYCKLSYIDDTVSSGTGYGFAIGMTKQLVYEAAREQFSEHQVYVLHPLDHRSYGPHVLIEFSDEEYSILRDRDRWDLYYDEGFFDALRLRFVDDALVEIHRHRNRCETP